MRGQYDGYRDEPGVAKDSDVETFCALRLYIDSWRWQGVPFYLRSGKCLERTATEVLVEFEPPPQLLFADAAPATGPPQLRSLPAVAEVRHRLRRAGQAARARNSSANSASWRSPTSVPANRRAYTRLLGDAMAGDGALFTREDAIEAAWAVVEPILQGPPSCVPTGAAAGGPEASDALIAGDGGVGQSGRGDDVGAARANARSL